MTILTNWAGNHWYTAPHLREPTSVRTSGLVAEHEQVRALGSRHSFTDIADTVRWFNPRTGGLVGVGGRVSPREGVLGMPDKPDDLDWVLVAPATDDTGGQR